MSRRVDRTNRVLLSLIAAVVLVAGALGLAAGWGAFGQQVSSDPVLPAGARSFAADSSWLWWVIAAGCVVIALLALRWLLSQLRVDRVSRIDLTADESDGLTVVHAGALTDAVSEEALEIRGVVRARAHVKAEPSRRLVLDVELADYADIAAVRDRLESQTVQHVRQALGQPDFPVDITLQPGQHAGRGLR